MNSIRFSSDEELTFSYVNWDQLGKLTEELAYSIISSKLEFDRIIALATGGLTMSRTIKDLLNSPKLSAIQIEFYTDIGKQSKTPIISQSLPANINNERVLVFDDINDSGKTLKTAVNYAKLRGASSVTTATIFQKPHTDFKSDYFGKETDSWIIFPDEIRETITLLSKRWKEMDIDIEKIKEQLLEIGFTKNQIETFI